MMARVAEDQGGSAHFDRERVERMLGLDVPGAVAAAPASAAAA